MISKMIFWVVLLALLGVVWADAGVRLLTLDEALRIARQNHPLIAQGKAGVVIQQGLETQVRSPALPQVNFLSSYTRANSKATAFGAGSAFTVYNTNFSLSQLVTDFGRTLDKIEAARQGVVQAKENVQSDLQQVLFNVHQAYFQLLEADAALQVQRETVQNLQNHLDQAQSFFSVGTQPKIGVTQAEVNLSNGKLALVQAENTFAISQTNLKAAIGKPDFPPFQVAEKLSAPHYAIALDAALKTAYDNRPDLRALVAQQEGAQASLTAAVKGFLPSISGTAGYGWNGDSFPPQPMTWNFGASFSVPVFNGLLTQGEIEQARGQLAQSTAQVDALKITIRQAVEQAYNNLAAAKTSLDVANESLKFAKENFELADGRFKVGVGNYLEFTDAQVNLTQAENNLIQTLGNYNIAVASLKQAMGTLEAP